MRRRYHIYFFSILLIFISEALLGESLVVPPYGHSHGLRKATQVNLSLFLPFAHFDNPEGVACTKMVARDDTSTVKDDDELVVYGVNSGRHQLIYNTSMWGLDAYGKKGTGKEQFRNPTGVCCDIYGNVFVVDAGNDRIVHLFNQKKKVKWVKMFNGVSENSSALKSPSQIDLDATGFIYVTDSGNRRIVIFDSFGTVLNVIDSTDGAVFVDGPTTLAVADGRTAWSYYKDERAIFCADKNGTRLWKIDFNGKVLKTIDIAQLYTAGYGAVDYYHNFWITDKYNHRLIKFDHELAVLDTFGSLGKDDNQFIEPRGIAIWKRFGQVFVAEKTGAQYYWIGTDLKNLKIQKIAGSLALKAHLTEYSYMSLFSAKQQDTIYLMRQQFVKPGASTQSIKLPQHYESSLKTFVLRIEPTYSSYTYRFWDYPATIER